MARLLPEGAYSAASAPTAVMVTPGALNGGDDQFAAGGQGVLGGFRTDSSDGDPGSGIQLGKIGVAVEDDGGVSGSGADALGICTVLAELSKI